MKQGYFLYIEKVLPKRLFVEHACYRLKNKKIYGSYHHHYRGLSRLTRYALRKHTRIDVYDFAGLLHLAGEYQISEVYVREDDWVAEKTLAELALPKEVLFVLGINRKNGHYSGIPGRETVICPGDTLIIYGRALGIKGINLRKKGEQGNLERKLAEKEYMSLKHKEQIEDKKAVDHKSFSIDKK